LLSRIREYRDAVNQEMLDSVDPFPMLVRISGNTRQSNKEAGSGYSTTSTFLSFLLKNEALESSTFSDHTFYVRSVWSDATFGKISKGYRLEMTSTSEVGEC
jgi:hypothetical protein